MYFQDRHDAGRQLAKVLKKYLRKNVVVFALPRGGSILGSVIAKRLEVPLDFIITRKISHPMQPEYALAAVSEKGKVTVSQGQVDFVDTEWFDEQVKKERAEAKRRKKVYLKERKAIIAKGKIAILVDDGVATGLTMKAAIEEVKQLSPKKILVAVPVGSYEVIEKLKKLVDEVICLFVPEKGTFLGSIGEYYDSFPQLSDRDVTKTLHSVEKRA